jgi:MFS family permease
LKIESTTCGCELTLSLGAPLGGIVNDTVGWRWAFIGQIPVLCLAGIMIFLKVRYTIPSPSSSGASTPVRKETAREKLARIDWLGSFLIAGMMGSMLIAVSLVTSSTGAVVEGFKPSNGIDLDAYKWTDPLILGLFSTSAALLVVFLYVEIFVAGEPVLPVELLTQRTPIFIAINNFTISALAFSTLYSVPLFFTAVKLMTAADAGVHLIPNSFLGSIGSLATGFIVRATGKYYWLTAFCGAFSIVSSILLAGWTRESADWLMWTSYAPMAFSMGSVTTLTIVGLIADIGREHVAVATSLSYVFRTTGQVLGVALSGALTQAVLQTELAKRITGPGAAEIIAAIRQSSDSIRNLPKGLQDAATASYQKALHAVFIVAIVLSVIGVVSALGMREVDMSPQPKQRAGEEDEQA